MVDVKIDTKTNKMTITCDVLPEMHETDSGKSFMYATSGGFVSLPNVITLNDKAGNERKLPLKLSLNCIVSNPDYVKPAKGLN